MRTLTNALPRYAGPLGLAGPDDEGSAAQGGTGGTHSGADAAHDREGTERDSYDSEGRGTKGGGGRGRSDDRTYNAEAVINSPRSLELDLDPERISIRQEIKNYAMKTGEVKPATLPGKIIDTLSVPVKGAVIAASGPWAPVTGAIVGQLSVGQKVY